MRRIDTSPIAARARIAERYPKLKDADFPRFVSAIASTVKVPAWRDIAVAYDPADPRVDQPPANAQDALDALSILAFVRRQMDQDERLLLDLARRQGATWPEIADALGLGSAQGASQRRRRLENVKLPAVVLDPERAGTG